VQDREPFWLDPDLKKKLGGTTQGVCVRMRLVGPLS
jgi:hypothetical protein